MFPAVLFLNSFFAKKNVFQGEAVPSRTILDTWTFYPRKTKVLPRLLKVKRAICQYQFTKSPFILHKF